MVRINRVHTGGGDDGETHLLDGSRVSKSDSRVELYGTIDEANSFIGMIRSELMRAPIEAPDGGPLTTFITSRDRAEAMLGRVQQELFDLGGECSCPPDSLPEAMALLTDDSCDLLLHEMDDMLVELKPLESFILPTGTAVVSACHLSRTVVRRAERYACSIIQGDPGGLRNTVVVYLNRLSDWLFVLARWLTLKQGEDETLWVPLGKRVA